MKVKCHPHLCKTCFNNNLGNIRFRENSLRPKWIKMKRSTSFFNCSSLLPIQDTSGCVYITDGTQL